MGSVGFGFALGNSQRDISLVQRSAFRNQGGIYYFFGVWLLRT